MELFSELVKLEALTNVGALFVKIIKGVQTEKVLPAE